MAETKHPLSSVFFVSECFTRIFLHWKSSGGVIGDLPSPRRFYAPNVTPAGRPADASPPPARSRRRGRRRRDGRGHAGRGGHAGDPRELLLGHRLAGQVEHRLEGAEALVLLSTVWGRARFGGVFQDAFKKLENREETRPLSRGQKQRR